MSFSSSEKKIILNNIGDISELFNVNEEREFLQQYFSVADIEECLQEDESRYVQTAALCMKMVKRSNKDFFDALSQHFLKRSVQYKQMYERMCSGVERSSREDRATTTPSKSEGSQDEVRRDDRWTSQRTQSTHLSDNAKTFDFNTMNLTIQVLREKIRQLEEERQFWMRDSADRGVQLFQYSDGARRRAEVETFGCYNKRCILCSASGLFSGGTRELGDEEDWSAVWREMVEDGSREMLAWCLMMPRPMENVVVWMGLVRRGDSLLIQTIYRKVDQRENAPPQITIDCEVSLTIENKDGTSTNTTKQKQHKMILVDVGEEEEDKDLFGEEEEEEEEDKDLSGEEEEEDNDVFDDFVTFPIQNWEVVNLQKPPTIKIQLINVEL